MKRIIAALIIALSVLSLSTVVSAEEDSIDCNLGEIYCLSQNTNILGKNLTDFQTPKLSAPEDPKITVTYDVQEAGSVNNIFEFKKLANETLNDGRGWARLGVEFNEVDQNGQFTLILSEASYLPTFSSGCSSEYSCRVGTSVIINQDRWNGATPSWNESGGSLRDYRHMVINHEVGHWLGHGHQSCSGTGQPAAVMQQQSIDLGGCAFNPWPLASELWSTQLGITL